MAGGALAPACMFMSDMFMPAIESAEVVVAIIRAAIGTEPDGST